MTRRVVFTALGVVGMAALTVMQFVPTYEHAQFVVLCLSLTALVVGLGDIPSESPLHRHRADVSGQHEAEGWTTTRAGQAMALLALTLIAFAVRAYRMNADMRALVDEINSFSPLISLWVYPDVSLLTHMNTAVIPYSWLYPYLQNGFVALLGNNLWGLRGLSLVGGALTVPIVYLLARTFHDDRRVAWVAAAMTVAFPLAIHYSRLGIHSSLDPFVGALAFLFLARGWQHGRPLDWALGGVWLGLTHYFWEGGRLFNTSFVILWFCWLALHQWDHIRRQWRGLVTAAFALLVTTVPLYITWALTGDEIESRLESSGVNSAFLADLLLATPDSDVLQGYLQDIANAFLVLFAIPESSRFYGGSYGFLLPFVSPFALIGLIWCLRRGRTLTGVLAWWTLAIPAANGLLLVNSHGSPRFLNLIPVLPIIVAIGVVWTAERLLARWRNIAVYGMAAALFVGQVGYYHSVHMPRFQTQVRNGRGDLDDATVRAARLPLDTHAVIVTDGPRDPRHPDRYMRYLYSNDPYPRISTMASSVFVDEMLAPDLLAGLPPGGYAFFILADDLPAQTALRARFGDVSFEETPYPVPPETAFRLYRVAR